MGNHRRALRAVFLAGALLISAVTTVNAGDEAGGDITFRLTLRGEVVDGDGFSLSVNAIDNPGIISPGILCGPGSEAYNPQFVECRPGSFEFVLEGREDRPVGTELEYIWARNHGESDSRVDTVIYTDRAAVTPNDQILTVVYDYGGTGLPDTAIRTSDGPMSVGFALSLTALALGGAFHWRTRPRKHPMP
jgi:hypothetical protein